jgi:SPP1 gp7 family putative phage head morphogenesis protein
MNDPTKTLMIRNRASKEIDRRFSKIRKFVRDSINIGKLVVNVSIVDPDKYVYMRDQDKIPEFNRELQKLIDQEILGLTDGTINNENYWLNVHIGQAYDKGARKVRIAAERAIVNLAKLPFYSPFINPAHVERAELIYTRVFNDMKNVTDVMRGQMSRVLAEGMLRGENPKKVAKAMINRVDAIGITRAKLIARTEIVESHNQASIKEAELLENETGVEIKMQWLTSIDGRERASHRSRHLVIYSRDEALSKLGEPNCRCSVSAYIDIEKL